MSTFLKHTKAVFVAMINICLLCGAGHVLEWIEFVITKKTSRTDRTKYQ